MKRLHERPTMISPLYILICDKQAKSLRLIKKIRENPGKSAQFACSQTSLISFLARGKGPPRGKGPAYLFRVQERK